MLSILFVIFAQTQSTTVPPRWDIYWPTVGLFVVTAIALISAIRTLGAIRDQVLEMRKSGEQTDKLIKEQIAQSKLMTSSVVEAARLSTAMEQVSVDMASSARSAATSASAINKQMRAYVCAQIGAALYQERSKNIKFQASVALVNAGLTPAHKVRFRSAAAIMQIPLPSDFRFPLPDAYSGGSILGPRQMMNVNPMVHRFCDDTDVETIKRGDGQAMYAWGEVQYEDIFGTQQWTKFCQIYTWLPDGKVMGYYAAEHNEAT